MCAASSPAGLTDSVSLSLLRNSQTLGVRGRRPTGKAKNRISHVEGSPPAASELRRSATTKPRARGDFPVQPVPYQPLRKIESQIPETSASGKKEAEREGGSGEREVVERGR